MDTLDFGENYYSKTYLIKLISSKFSKFRLDHREKENRNNEGWRNVEFYNGKVNGIKYLIKIVQNINVDQWRLVYITQLYQS